MRIAVGGIHVECSTYNPAPTRTGDFTVLRGAELTGAAQFAFLGDHAASFVPVLHARAIPGGPVARETYEALKSEMLDRLASAGPLDGVYLAMHGAMFVEGMEDAEGDWIEAVRRVVGEAPPIAVSYDLHGAVSQRIVDAIDIFTAYRTAPHIDVEATMRRAVTMLTRAIETRRAPFVVWSPIPVALSGEYTSTQDEPAHSLYRGLADIEATDGIWDAALMVGYVWADEPRSAAAAVMTGTDLGALSTAAEALARAYWEAREAFAFGDWSGSIGACLDRATASDRRPFVIADSGDNPTGGGVGDRPDMLRALLERAPQETIVAGIADPAATDLAYGAGLGQRLETAVGAALDPAGGPPLPIAGEVVFLAEAATAAERQAVVRVGGVDLVLTGRRRPFHTLRDFTALGLDPAAAGLIVVKSGYLSPELAALAADNAMALSPGVVDQDLRRLTRTRKTWPTFPFDTDFAWTPQARPSVRRRT
jgi:microcystin degradation protein MlrC